MDPDILAQMNAAGAGNFNETLGLVFVDATDDRVTGYAEITKAHHQPFGLVHGGVWCGLVETFASMGGAVSAIPLGKNVVGVSNTTDFLRPFFEGRVEVEATAIHRGRTQHLWQVTITSGEGKLIARGQVRLQVIDPATTQNRNA